MYRFIRWISNANKERIFEVYECITTMKGLRKLSEKEEKRKKIAYERRAGTEIRRAEVEREAIVAPYHLDIAKKRRDYVLNIFDKILRLLPQNEVEMFTGAITAKDEEMKTIATMSGLLVVIVKLITAPMIINDIDTALLIYTDTIRTANRSKEELRSEGIDVGENIPEPTTFPDLLSKIYALKLLLSGLDDAIAYFSWLRCFI